MVSIAIEKNAFFSKLNSIFIAYDNCHRSYQTYNSVQFELEIESDIYEY